MQIPYARSTDDTEIPQHFSWEGRLTGSTRNSLSSVSDGDVVVKRIYILTPHTAPPSSSATTGLVRSSIILEYIAATTSKFRFVATTGRLPVEILHADIDGSVTAEGASVTVSPSPPTSHHLSLRLEVIRRTHILSDVDGRRVRPVVEHFRHASLRRNPTTTSMHAGEHVGR